MKAALAPGGELIRRAGRVLLADSRIELLGVRHPQGDDPRLATADDLGLFDVVVAEELGTPETQEAWDRQIPIVTAAELVTPDPHSLVTHGADLSGLAGALGELARMRAGADHVQVAWTAPGRPLRSGTQVVFPQPIGALRCSRTGNTAVAPHDSEFAAILVAATGPKGTVTHGVVDRQGFLDAICLAAAVFARAKGPGGPASRLGAGYVEEALAAGLSVASKAA